MAKIQIDIPDNPRASDVRVIYEEERKGVKKQLEKIWKSTIRRYRPLKFPISCEYCSYVGEAIWHCHNRESRKYGINVTPWDVCSKWMPNTGLMMYLHRRYFQAEIDRLNLEWEKQKKEKRKHGEE